MWPQSLGHNDQTEDKDRAGVWPGAQERLSDGRHPAREEFSLRGPRFRAPANSDLWEHKVRAGGRGGSSKGQGAAHPEGGVGAGGGCRLAPPKGSTQRHCQAVGPTIFPTFVEMGRCR